MDMASDTDSGRQETSSEEDSVGEEGDNEDDEEVQVVTVTPLLFPRTTVPVTPGLVPAGLHMAHIPGFGETRWPILMTGETRQPIHPVHFHSQSCSIPYWVKFILFLVT